MGSLQIKDQPISREKAIERLQKAAATMSENPVVIKNRKEMGDFNYGPEPPGIGKVEFREMYYFDDGRSYLGFW